MRCNVLVVICTQVYSCVRSGHGLKLHVHSFSLHKLNGATRFTFLSDSSWPFSPPPLASNVTHAPKAKWHTTTKANHCCLEENIFTQHPYKQSCEEIPMYSTCTNTCKKCQALELQTHFFTTLLCTVVMCTDVE